MQWRVTINSKDVVVELPDAIPDNAPFLAVIAGKQITVRFQKSTKALYLGSGNNAAAQAVHVRYVQANKFAGESELNVQAEIATKGRTACFEAAVGLHIPGQDKKGASAKKAKTVRSQITGKVLKILVSPGQQIEAGATLMIVEAMKMENRVLAPVAATVAAVLPKEGDTVAAGAELIKFAD